jgi:hypothetical protein
MLACCALDAASWACCALLATSSLSRRAFGLGACPAPAPPAPPAAPAAPELRRVGQADDKEAALRKEARDARLRAAELSDQARRLRALAQKGVNNVLEAAEEPRS